MVLDEGSQIVSDDFLVQFFLLLTDEADDIFWIKYNEFVRGKRGGLEFRSDQRD